MIPLILSSLPLTNLGKLELQPMDVLDVSEVKFDHVHVSLSKNNCILTELFRCFNNKDISLVTLFPELFIC